MELAGVDAANWEAVVALRPAPEQQGFVAPNWYSLLEACYRPGLVPLLARAEGEPVGFAMYGWDPDDRQPWIYRIMVDARYQGRGYGRLILDLTVGRVRRHYPGQGLALGYKPGNAAAERLYSSAGFVPSGEVIGGEVVARLPPDGR